MTFKPAEFPYHVALSMAELGRRAEALAAMREIEPKIPTRVRYLVTAARFLLEGKAAESIAAVNHFVGGSAILRRSTTQHGISPI